MIGYATSLRPFRRVLSRNDVFNERLQASEALSSWKSLRNLLIDDITFTGQRLAAVIDHGPLKSYTVRLTIQREPLFTAKNADA